MTDYTRLQKKIGYQFNDLQLLQQALTHRSYSGINNERLEFLGDAIVSFIIANALYENFPRLEEGSLSRFRSSLVKGETLAAMAHGFALSDYLQLGSGEKRSGGFRRPSILADALEALIGAIYLDSDVETCQSVVLQWFVERLKNVAETAESKDPKTTLQEYLQAQKLALPHYELTDIQGAEHQQVFFIECRVPGLGFVTKGQGSNRRKAEQLAAERFLESLKNTS